MQEEFPDNIILVSNTRLSRSSFSDLARVQVENDDLDDFDDFDDLNLAQSSYCLGHFE